MSSDVFVLVVRSARSGGEKAPGSARRRGQRGQRVHEFFSFFVSFVVCVWGCLIRFPFFVSQLLLSSAFKKLHLCVLLIKNTHSNYLVRTSEEESGYKKCCTRFVLEPRIGRSSSARTSAAAAAEGEQHRVQQQRAAAARFG